MFGKRSGSENDTRTVAVATAPQPAAAMPAAGAAVPKVASPPISPARAVPPVVEARRSDAYYQVKATIFGALIEAIDLAQLAKLDTESAREEIR
ncbi:MAG: type secretion system protein, partial [Tardiphaga sp.]|nr:type secretion system protein [Tardiphaga sp.]